MQDDLLPDRNAVMKIEISRKGDDEALAVAEASRHEMARLLAVAGHDLKQPLQLAMLSIDRAAGQGVAFPVANRLGVALEALRRLNSELDDIARLSQSGEALVAQRRPVELAEIIARVERDWRAYADLCNTQLQIQVPRAVVETDPEMLGTILRNLVGNAIKFSGPGGRVCIAARLGRDQVTIDVHDTGGGIPAEQFSTMFDAFRRGSQAQRTDGLGLGLLIVRQTAQLLKLPISVRTAENEGSTFSIELPLARLSDGPAAAQGFGATDLGHVRLS